MNSFTDESFWIWFTDEMIVAPQPSSAEGLPEGAAETQADSDADLSTLCLGIGIYSCHPHYCYVILLLGHILASVIYLFLYFETDLKKAQLTGINYWMSGSRYRRRLSHPFSSSGKSMLVCRTAFSGSDSLLLCVHLNQIPGLCY